MSSDNKNWQSQAFLICPIPMTKQPVYQYWSLKQDGFSSWAVLKHKEYRTRLLAVWLAGVLFGIYAVVVTKSNHQLSNLDLIWSAIIGEVATLFCWLKLYAIWHYVYSGLLREKVTYQIPYSKTKIFWHKPQVIVARDRLIASFQVKPILQRLKQTMLLLFVSFLLTLGILLTLSK